MFWLRHSVWAGLTVAALLPFAAAQAQAPGSRSIADVVRVNAGATCLNRDALAEHVASWLGTTQADARLSVRVDGSPRDARTVWFRIQRADTLLSERRFEPGPARCEDLQAAVGLAIALAIKASLLDSFSPTKADDTAERSPETVDWELGLDLMAAYSVVPGTAFGGGLQLQRRLMHTFRGRLGVVALGGLDRDFPQVAGHFDIWLLMTRLDLCDAFELSERVHASVCVGLALGGNFVRGRDLAPSRSGRALFLAGANALDVGFDLNATWAIQLAIHVIFPVFRTGVEVREADGEVADTVEFAAAGAVLSVGPRLRF